jgi:hypothetical protein
MNEITLKILTFTGVGLLTSVVIGYWAFALYMYYSGKIHGVMTIIAIYFVGGFFSSICILLCMAIYENYTEVEGL